MPAKYKTNALIFKQKQENRENEALFKFRQIQDLQLKKDELVKQWREIGKEIRSISQKIPQMLRELKLR